jgi:hypothetical protein
MDLIDNIQIPLEKVRKEGCSKISLFPIDKVSLIKDVVDAELKEEQHSFYNSGSDKNLERKQKFKELILHTLSEDIHRNFSDYCIARIVIISKGIGAHSACILHTDDNSFDENTGYPLNIWTPLSDTNSRNGAMNIIPCSHQYAPKVRGFGIPKFYDSLQEQLIKKAVQIDTTFGESLLYHPGILHFTKENHTDAKRYAIVIGLAPKNATQLVYIGKKSWWRHRLYTLKMSLEDYLHWNERSTPSKLILDSIPFRKVKLPENTYHDFLKQNS